MIIEKTVTECDFTGKKFSRPQSGVAYLARGNTGRWCEVMHGGPDVREQLEKDDCEILTAAEARTKIEQEEGCGWADF